MTMVSIEAPGARMVSIEAPDWAAVALDNVPDARRRQRRLDRVSQVKGRDTGSMFPSRPVVQAV
jgi:hypothetical protein